MKGKAFYKKIEKAPNAYWRGAKLESYGDEAYLRVALKTTGATYEITGDAIQRLTAADVDGLLVGKLPANCPGIKRVMVTGNMVFPYAWSAATCLAVCVAKYPKRPTAEEVGDDDGDDGDASDVVNADDAASEEEAEDGAEAPSEVEEDCVR